MNKYQVIMEIWKARGAFDPSEKDFFECACCDPSGVDAEEVLAVFDTKEDALAELAKHKCTYEKWENYNETRFELYAAEEIIYDDDGDIEDYSFIKYADVEL